MTQGGSNLGKILWFQKALWDLYIDSEIAEVINYEWADGEGSADWT